MSGGATIHAHTEKSSTYLKGFIRALKSATIPSKAKKDITADYWNKWAFVAWERALVENDPGIRDEWLQAADHCLANIDRPSPLSQKLWPRDVARTVLFLASDDAAGITGAALEVYGGTHLTIQA